jgi:hypothetical protein
MPKAIELRLELPSDLARFRLPKGVEKRLHALLDKQDEGSALTSAEKQEAEGLVELVDTLSFLKLRARRLSGSRS